METQIQDFRYVVEMGCGLDMWRPCGHVLNHPNFPDGHFVYTSTPVELDEQNLKFTTASGRVYQIVSFSDDQTKVLDQIKKDIANKGSECW